MHTASSSPMTDCERRRHMITLALALVVALVVCGGVLLQVATTAWPRGTTPPSSTPSAAPLRWQTPYPWPAPLAAYSVVVTDFTAGEVGVLGARTVVTAGGPHGISVQPGGAFVWVMNSGRPTFGSSTVGCSASWQR